MVKRRLPSWLLLLLVAQYTDAITATSDTLPSCPPKYNPSKTNYTSGSQISIEDQIWECGLFPFEPYCNIAEFDGSLLEENSRAEFLWTNAWEFVGNCDESAATSAPSLAPVTDAPTASPSPNPTRKPSRGPVTHEPTSSPSLITTDATLTSSSAFAKEPTSSPISKQTTLMPTSIVPISTFGLTLHTTESGDIDGNALHDIISDAIYEQLTNELPKKYTVHSLILAMSLLTSPGEGRRLRETIFYEYIVTTNVMFTGNDTPSTEDVMDIVMTTPYDLSAFQEAEDPVLQSVEDIEIFSLTQIENPLTLPDEPVDETTDTYLLFLIGAIPVVVLIVGSVFYRRAVLRDIEEEDEGDMVPVHLEELSDSESLRAELSDISEEENQTQSSISEGEEMKRNASSSSLQSSTTSTPQTSVAKSRHSIFDKYLNAKTKKNSRGNINQYRTNSDALFAPSMSGSGSGIDSYEYDDEHEKSNDFNCVDARQELEDDIMDAISLDCGMGSRY